MLKTKVNMDKPHNQTLDTETLILQAAEREFLEKGFSGAKTTSIAQTAGVTHAMLHYYFRTKERLFDRIMSDKIDNLSQMILVAMGDSDLPLADRLREGIERHFDFLLANPKLPRFIINEIAANPSRIEPIRQKLLERAQLVLTNFQAELDRLPDVEVNAVTLMADIISLNAFPFVAESIISAVAGELIGNREQYLAQRKRENVRTILTKLKLI